MGKLVAAKKGTETSKNQTGDRYLRTCFAKIEQKTLFLYNANNRKEGLGAIILTEYDIELVDKEGYGEDRIYSTKLPIPIEKEDWYFSLLSSSLGEPNNSPKSKLEQIFSDSESWLSKNKHNFRTDDESSWLNALVNRILLGAINTTVVRELFIDQANTKLGRLANTSIISDIDVVGIDLGKSVPSFTNFKLLGVDDQGQTKVKGHMEYMGEVSLTLKIELVLVNIKVPIVVKLVVSKVAGDFMLLIKRPPSNRIWLGFFDSPELEFDLEPKIMHKEIKYTTIVQLLKNKLLELFKNNMVLPNMDDFVFIESKNKGGVFEEMIHYKNNNEAEFIKNGSENQNEPLSKDKNTNSAIRLNDIDNFINTSDENSNLKHQKNKDFGLVTDGKNSLKNISGEDVYEGTKLSLCDEHNVSDCKDKQESHSEFSENVPEAATVENEEKSHSKYPLRSETETSNEPSFLVENKTKGFPTKILYLARDTEQSRLANLSVSKTPKKPFYLEIGDNIRKQKLGLGKKRALSKPKTSLETNTDLYKLLYGQNNTEIISGSEDMPVVFIDEINPQNALIDKIKPEPTDIEKCVNNPSNELINSIPTNFEVDETPVPTETTKPKEPEETFISKEQKKLSKQKKEIVLDAFDNCSDTNPLEGNNEPFTEKSEENDYIESIIKTGNKSLKSSDTTTSMKAREDENCDISETLIDTKTIESETHSCVDNNTEPSAGNIESESRKNLRYSDNSRNNGNEVRKLFESLEKEAVKFDSNLNCNFDSGKKDYFQHDETDNNKSSKLSLISEKESSHSSVNSNDDTDDYETFYNLDNGFVIRKPKPHTANGESTQKTKRNNRTKTPEPKHVSIGSVSGKSLSDTTKKLIWGDIDDKVYSPNSKGSYNIEDIRKKTNFEYGDMNEPIIGLLGEEKDPLFKNVNSEKYNEGQPAQKDVRVYKNSDLFNQNKNDSPETITDKKRRISDHGKTSKFPENKDSIQFVDHFEQINQEQGLKARKDKESVINSSLKSTTDDKSIVESASKNTKTSTNYVSPSKSGRRYTTSSRPQPPNIGLVTEFPKAAVTMRGLVGDNENFEIQSDRINPTPFFGVEANSRISFQNITRTNQVGQTSRFLDSYELPKEKVRHRYSVDITTNNENSLASRISSSKQVLSRQGLYTKESIELDLNNKKSLESQRVLLQPLPKLNLKKF
ncbi:hypothetical protein BB558_000343 [Smittium angustum]|uniref:SMP-LTD domain-containing protein n=1 Tax=Smittium angustum TaxID=133377 RepID=A0A2U1JEG2_SMIAN|nr:hypothetical protein BB558_000343 [Smittium angustum]